MKYYSNNIYSLAGNQVFVFGSNLAGRHGAGAAKQAYEDFGAEWSVGVGPTGQCYALPTKDNFIQTLSLFSIKQYVFFLKQYAMKKSELEFIVTKVGCGLAGYTDEQIAPLFKNSPDNLTFHRDWKPYLE